MQQTPLQNAIQGHEKKHLTNFKPSKDFYQQMSINRIRFAKLVSGKKPILASEAKNLSDFFQVPITDLF
jgi:hypothetical protein